MNDNIMKKNRKSKYGNDWKRILFIVGMLALPMINFIVFTVYANFGGVLLSFRQFKDGREIFVGFENYKKFFDGMQHDNILQVILVSLAWLPVVGGVMFPISVVTSFFLYKKIPLSGLIIVLLFLPNIIPAALLAEFYRRMWDSGVGDMKAGILNRIFSVLTGEKINWLASAKYANWALWLYTIWFGFGFYAILIWGAMSRVPKELVESAQLDGAGLSTEFFRITIPVIWPTLSMVIVLYLLVPFTVYMQPLLIADGGRNGTRTIALKVIQELRRPNPYYSAAISILIACVSMPLVLVAKWLLGKVFTVVEI